MSEFRAQSCVQIFALANHLVQEMCLAEFDGKFCFKLRFNIMEMNVALES